MVNPTFANFDLNINNYTIKELEELFELPPNGYDHDLLEQQESKLRQNIIGDYTINVTMKTGTLQFISEVKNKLKDWIQSRVKGVSDIIKSYEKVYNVEKQLMPSDTVNGGNTFIIKQPPTPYGQSFPSEFYQGAINPLMKRSLRQNINIDTRFRENYYTSVSTNFHLDLPIKLTKVVSLQLSALEFPTLFYTISKSFGNNFFVINSGPTNSLLITIPDGNYTSLALQQYINNFIDTYGGAPFANNIQFFHDLNSSSGIGGSGKMIAGLTAAGIAAGTTFELNFLTDAQGQEDRQTPLPLKLGWMMGYRAGFYENNTTYISEGIVELTGPRYVYLVVDDYNNNVNDGFFGAFTSSILNKNILARISLSGSIFNVVAKDNLNLITTPRQYFGPVDIQKLHIQILDEYGRVLNINNMDYSFCLTFQTIYDL